MEYLGAARASATEENPETQPTLQCQGITFHSLSRANWILNICLSEGGRIHRPYLLICLSEAVTTGSQERTTGQNKAVVRTLVRPPDCPTKLCNTPLIFLK